MPKIERLKYELYFTVKNLGLFLYQDEKLDHFIISSRFYLAQFNLVYILTILAPVSVLLKIQSF